MEWQIVIYMVGLFKNKNKDDKNNEKNPIPPDGTGQNPDTRILSNIIQDLGDIKSFAEFLGNHQSITNIMINTNTEPGFAEVRTIGGADQEGQKRFKVPIEWIEELEKSIIKNSFIDMKASGLNVKLYKKSN